MEIQIGFNDEQKLRNFAKWLKKEEPKVTEVEAPSKEVKTLSNKMIQSNITEKKPTNEEERVLAAIRILNGG